MSKHYLERIIWPPIGIVNYKGLLVEKVKGGYKIFNQTVLTPEKVDEVLREAAEALNKSIAK